jgi:hypothetical protein
MIALVLAWLGGLAVARIIHHIPLALLCAFLVGVLASLIGVSLTYVLGHGAFTMGQIFATFLAGCIWLPIIAMVAVMVHRKRRPSPLDELERYVRLRSEGQITAEEFEAHKNRLMKGQ